MSQRLDLATTPLHLRSAGTSLLLASPAPGRLPVVCHWGDDLGELTESEARQLVEALVPPVVSDQIEGTPECTLAPDPSLAWFGTPGFELTVGRRPVSQMQLREATLTQRPDHQLLRLVATDADATTGPELILELRMHHWGLVSHRISVRATDEPVRVASLTPTLPVPSLASELLDLTGHHLRERSPQRARFNVGTHLRENRRGRTGLQAATYLVAGEPGFNFGTGQVWGAHVGWSGNQRLLAERMHTDHRTLAGGELLAEGEVVLQPGEQYQSPWVHFTHGHGLDALGSQWHQYLRTRPGRATRARPVTLNTWEAVYFDHDLDTLTALAREAAAIGVERFVLDDGWFGARRGDDAGLGDWVVSSEVWPDGLRPLIDQVTGLGMEFGLWVEPEMVNPNSDLARAHPDWLLGQVGRDPITARNQQVLDLANPQAFEQIRDQLLALLDQYDIAYLKWDHNRDLLEPISRTRGQAGVHDQTLAFYRLVDALKAAHPGLEIESCSSGGGRVDLEVLSRTDRIWTSDCIDPIERDQIQRWTGLLVPPELMGNHVGSATAHTTGRTTTLDMRINTAFLGHFGAEWNLTTQSDDDLAALKRAITCWKQWRDHLASGRVVHGDHTGSGRSITGVVSPAGDRALYCISVISTDETYPSGRIRLPGLDPERRFRVDVLSPTGTEPPGAAPDWTRDGLTMTGRTLTTAGIASITQPPGSAILLQLSAQN